MPLFRFRVCWEEDDQIFRDIVLKSGQTFDQFQTAIFKAFEIKKSLPASFFESNDRWIEGREISSEVLVNKKDAAALAMIKTPVSALVNEPDKHFLFRYDPEKKWLFQISLIALDKEDDAALDFPVIVKSEGISPLNTSGQIQAKEGMTDTDDQFDLSADDMEEQGFGEDQGF